MDRDEVHEYTALSHHFFYVAKAQWVGHIPTHADQHNLKGLMQPFENLAMVQLIRLLRKSSMVKTVVHDYCNTTAGDVIGLYAAP